MERINNFDFGRPPVDQRSGTDALKKLFDKRNDFEKGRKNNDFSEPVFTLPDLDGKPEAEHREIGMERNAISSAESINGNPPGDVEEGFDSPREPLPAGSGDQEQSSMESGDSINLDSNSALVTNGEKQVQVSAVSETENARSLRNKNRKGNVSAENTESPSQKNSRTTIQQENISGNKVTVQASLQTRKALGTAMQSQAVENQQYVDARLESGTPYAVTGNKMLANLTEEETGRQSERKLSLFEAKSGDLKNESAFGTMGNFSRSPRWKVAETGNSAQTLFNTESNNHSGQNQAVPNGSASVMSSSEARTEFHVSASRQNEMDAQILKQLERMTQAGKGQMKFQLEIPGEKSIEMQLSLKGGQILLGFAEGSDAFRSQLKRGWQRLVDRAASRGIQLRMGSGHGKLERRDREYFLGNDSGTFEGALDPDRRRSKRAGHLDRSEAHRWA